MALSTLASTVSMCDGLSFEGLIQITVEVSVEEGVGKRVHVEMLCFGASCGPSLKFRVVLRGTVVSACLLN